MGKLHKLSNIPTYHVVRATATHVTIGGNSTEAECGEERDEHADAQHAQCSNDASLPSGPTKAHEHDSTHDVEAAWDEAAIQRAQLVLDGLVVMWLAIMCCIGGVVRGVLVLLKQRLKLTVAHGLHITSHDTHSLQ